MEKGLCARLLLAALIGALIAFYIAAVFAVGYGWIENVIKLFGSDFAHLTGALVLRCIGVFVAPLGVVMGYL